MVSPPMPSGSRLVAIRWTLGHLSKMALATSAHALDQVLAVVEHDEHVLELEGVEQGLEHRADRLGS